ncbi:MAG: 5'-3' exonuclease H3TH domain-containing protein, partial [Clostridia bacterium]|nr:5'-3' exonuclease H3TH domain-containing protein [Clostridia bacterium]
MKQLIAIDGNSLLHRAFYALPPMTTAAGVPTGALHGFLSMLLKLAAREPDYLLVAFDMHGPTFRHAFYEDYKAGRRETPEDLRAQFPILKELLREMGIAVCECESYEADDILGTFARRCGEAGVSALLVTGDRDALQLVSGSAHVLMTKKGITETEEFDIDALQAAYGLSPERMRDLKGLMGDASDNIPGIPGVGEKTALKLLAQYGTLEDVLAHADEIPGKLGERVRQNTEQARLSYRLGTIDTDAPVDVPLSACAFDAARMAAARPHLLKLELRSLAARLPAGNAAPPAGGADAAPELVSIDSEEALLSFLAAYRAEKCVALHAGEGLSIAFSPARAAAVAGAADLFHAALDDAALWSALAPYLEDAECTLLCFDSKRLRHLAAAQGLSLRCAVFDAMIADYLLNAIRPAGSLRALCQQRLSAEREDAAALFLLREPMLRELDEAGMAGLYTDMELPLAR